MDKNRYQLRKAAGKYRLLDMNQDGKNPCREVAMNETGVLLWKEYLKTESTEAAARKLALVYGLSEQESLADAEAFFEQLRSRGIVLD